MQSSMFTYSRLRARSGSFNFTSGYWMVTAGVNRCLNVTFIPMRTVQMERKISLKYCFIARSEHHPDACADDARERPGGQDLPRDIHELVHPKPGERPP